MAEVIKKRGRRKKTETLIPDIKPIETNPVIEERVKQTGKKPRWWTVKRPFFAKHRRWEVGEQFNESNLSVKELQAIGFEFVLEGKHNIQSQKRKEKIELKRERTAGIL